MKKFIAFVAIIGLAFSACNGKYTIAKRKYTKGFYIAKSNSNNTKATEQVKPAKINGSGEKVETVVVSRSTVEIKDQEIPSVKEVANNSSTSTNPSQSKKTHDNAVASVAKTEHASSAHIKPLKIENNKSNSAKKGDGNLVLMIILALFPILCLIAVYMHDGKVTVNFWIDLLLHLTVIGEIIFALLVVLDVVDLS